MPERQRTSSLPFMRTPSSSNANGRSTCTPSSAAMRRGKRRVAVARARAARRARPRRPSRPGTSRRTSGVEVLGHGRPDARSTRSSRRWTASPISVAMERQPRRSPPHGRPGDGPHARPPAPRSSGTSSARRARARCTRAARRRWSGGSGTAASSRSRGRRGRHGLARALEQRELARSRPRATAPARRREGARIGAGPGRRGEHRGRPRSTSTGTAAAIPRLVLEAEAVSTQPIGVSSLASPRSPIEPRDDQALHRPCHRDVVEAEPLRLLGAVAVRLHVLVRGGADPRPGRGMGDLEAEAAVGEARGCRRRAAGSARRRRRRRP